MEYGVWSMRYEGETRAGSTMGFKTPGSAKLRISDSGGTGSGQAWPAQDDCWPRQAQRLVCLAAIRSTLALAKALAVCSRLSSLAATVLSLTSGRVALRWL